MKTKSVLLLGLFMAALSCTAAPEIVAARSAKEPVIDGKLDDCWKQAAWVTLDLSRPALPRDEEKWRELSEMVGDYVKTQFRQKVRAAVLWSDRGLFFAFAVEDSDVIGRMKDGEMLWLEDVVEVFLAREARTGEKHVEIQINPANAVLSEVSDGSILSRPETGVAVNGTLNDSREKDTGWTAELFLPWQELERLKLAARPSRANGGKVGAIRFAAWDLTTYTQLRINRFTGPGTAEPHFPEHYRPLICR